MDCVIVTKLNFKIILILISVIVVITSILLDITDGGSKLNTSYNINETKTLKSAVYDLISDTSLSLFPVPQDNSIGTNDLNNAITLISFQKGKIRYDKYFKNAVDDVEGGGEYIPIVAPDTIGFGQSRRFLLYNFRTRDCREYQIVVSLEKTIEKIAIANAARRHFIFEIEAGNPRSEDPWDITHQLLLMDLSGKEARLVKEIPREKGVTWSVVSDKIFFYARRKEQLWVLNMNFDPAYHPLADVIRSNKGKISFTWIHPHPFLPFAILSGGEEGSTIVSWGEGRDTTPKPLIIGADQFLFSPDGKWVVFKKYIDLETEKTYLIPVSEKYPHYLGTPILLLDNYFNPNNCGWTTNPIAFVGSISNKLYRWELTKEAHPWIDKATLHDYVVDYDLEKMKKDKQQRPGGEHK